MPKSWDTTPPRWRPEVSEKQKAFNSGLVEWKGSNHRAGAKKEANYVRGINVPFHDSHDGDENENVKSTIG